MEPLHLDDEFTNSMDLGSTLLRITMEQSMIPKGHPVQYEAREGLVEKVLPVLILKIGDANDEEVWEHPSTIVGNIHSPIYDYIYEVLDVT